MTEKKDLSTEADVQLLVRTFYAKVREDDLLGPIFNGIITDWEPHLARISDFWMSNLFFSKKYLGDPMQKHIEVDQGPHGTINEMHFGVWINLWYETMDELFEGEVASRAKNRARSMGTFIHLKIFEARKKREDEI
ncbi:MAG: group III truncated hemoglobin [Bacteroidota bacterium]